MTASWRLWLGLLSRKAKAKPSGRSFFGEQYNFGLFQFINNIFVLVSYVFVYLNYFDSESTASTCFSKFTILFTLANDYLPLVLSIHDV